MKSLRLTPLLLALVVAGCTEDDPTPTPTDTGTDAETDLGGGDASADGDDNGAPDTAPDSANDAETDAETDAVPDAETDAADDAAADGTGDATDDADAVEPVVCEPLASDYAPGADDTWPACVSDGGTYVSFEPTASTTARVAAFESIADLLWRTTAPDSDAFLDARELYATGEGLESRVVRREDEHYPPVSDGMGGTLSCRDEGVPALDPDRCVGPAQIQPLVSEAFAAGIRGEEPDLNAARIEAALLWFLYVSTHKEAFTCTTVQRDCDSSHAYYTGGQPFDAAIGLAGYLRDLDADAHDRVTDGILAVRCWRDLDGEATATNLALRGQALAQLDRALLRGLAVVVLDRIARWEESSSATDAAFLEVLAPVLTREATARDATQGAALAAALEAADYAAAAPLIASLFPCP
jgi:hypothetical protein